MLEKEIPFEAVVVDLPNKQHLRPEFLALNPFHHVPVISKGDFRLIESCAILDYLERAYPKSALITVSADAIATMKMVQLVITNELMPKISQVVMLEQGSLPAATASQLHQVMLFLETQLAQHTYFGGEHLNLADIVAGATIPLFQRLGFSLAPYPALSRWCAAVTARPAWQTSSPSDLELEGWQQVLRRWAQISQKHQQRQKS